MGLLANKQPVIKLPMHPLNIAAAPRSMKRWGKDLLRQPLVIVAIGATSKEVAGDGTTHTVPDDNR